MVISPECPSPMSPSPPGMTLNPNIVPDEVAEDTVDDALRLTIRLGAKTPLEGPDWLLVNTLVFCYFTLIAPPGPDAQDPFKVTGSNVQTLLTKPGTWLVSTFTATWLGPTWETELAGI